MKVELPILYTYSLSCPTRQVTLPTLHPTPYHTHPIEKKPLFPPPNSPTHIITIACTCMSLNMSINEFSIDSPHFLSFITIFIINYWVDTYQTSFELKINKIKKYISCHILLKNNTKILKNKKSSSTINMKRTKSRIHKSK